MGWRPHRLPGWSSDAAEPHGMALAARDREEQREAVLEFPAGPQSSSLSDLAHWRGVW